MTDLISRSDAIEAINRQWLHGVNVPICEEIRTAIVQIISALPSADAVHIETYRELYEKYVELKHASAEAVQIPIKLEKRYPESKDEDITDAFMRGYLAGRSSAEAVQGNSCDGCRYTGIIEKCEQCRRLYTALDDLYKGGDSE